MEKETTHLVMKRETTHLVMCTCTCTCTTRWVVSCLKQGPRISPARGRFTLLCLSNRHIWSCRVHDGYNDPAGYGGAK